MKDKFVQIPQGRIHYLEAGDGDPLVLLHSNGCSVHEYDRVYGELADRFRILSIDMLGHGDSERITKHHSVNAYSDIVIQFMDAVGVDKAWVLGASIGGFICADLGDRYPSRILGVLLVEAALRTERDWSSQWSVVEQMFGQAVQQTEQVAPRFRAFTPQLLARWNVDRAKAGAWTMIDVMWAIREYDLSAALSRIRAPVALIFGDRGPVTASIPQYIEALPKAPRYILDDCGHFPMIDDPQRFIEATFASVESLRALEL